MHVNGHSYTHVHKHTGTHMIKLYTAPTPLDRGVEKSRGDVIGTPVQMINLGNVNKSLLDFFFFV